MQLDQEDDLSEERVGNARSGRENEGLSSPGTSPENGTNGHQPLHQNSYLVSESSTRQSRMDSKMGFEE